MNRRGLLKWFGAGAAIVPVVKGAPILEAKAELIEPPRVQPISQALPTLDPRRAFLGRDELDAMVILRDRKTGGTCVIEGKTFLLSYHQEIQDITTYGDSLWRTKIAVGLPECTWRLKEISGLMTGPVHFHET